MEWQKLIEALKSGDEHQRLSAARKLGRDPKPEMRPALELALASERLHWVRTALTHAISSIDSSRSSQSRPPLVPPDQGDLEQARLDGERKGLLRALHEFGGPLGMARAAAKKEVDSDSPLMAHLERLRAVSSGLRQIVNASAPPEFIEFDLAAVLRSFSEHPPMKSPKGLLILRGISPFTVRSDPDLIWLAVLPLLCNAIEEELAAHRVPRARSIIVSWGSDAHNHWIAVIDDGRGPPESSEIYELGASGKEGHLGFGLSTSRTAMNSLGGTLLLEKNGSGGASAHLEWPK